MKKALLDQGFKKKVVEHGMNVGIDVEIVERAPDDKGFVPQAQAVDRGDLSSTCSKPS